MVGGGERGTIDRVGGVLYLVGTPIGNLGDLSDRARETLASVAVVAAEDTRRTGRLLRGLDIRKPLVSMFEGNEDERAAELVERLDAGRGRRGRHRRRHAERVGPGVPGRPARRRNEGSTCASCPARRPRSPPSSSPDSRPTGSRSRASCRGAPAIAADGSRRSGTTRGRSSSSNPRGVSARCSARSSRALGDRRVAVCRELTKLHEEVLRGTVAEVLDAIGERELKGEVAVVVEGEHEGAPLDRAALLEEVRRLIDEGMRTRDAARAVAERHGASANDLYRAAIASD